MTTDNVNSAKQVKALEMAPARYERAPARDPLMKLTKWSKMFPRKHPDESPVILRLLTSQKTKTVNLFPLAEDREEFHPLFDAHCGSEIKLVVFQAALVESKRC